jgi:uncharacterized protein (TIGR03118 family)
MHYHTFPRFARSAPAATLALALALGACSDNSVTNVVSPLNAFTQTNLVADAGGASVTDPSLVNPWGIAFSPTGILWVSNNGTGTSTLYDSLGNKLSTVVTVPGAGASAGTPTGVIFNATTDFSVGAAGPALFIFASEDGTISAWNGLTGNAITEVNRSSNGAVYKGVAMASNAGANFLYATNFKGNAVEMFDATFTMRGSFTDATVPAGYGPFGIANIGGQLYVTYAKQTADSMDDVAGVGNGFVDVFNADGTLARRFASGGRLNSPWAVAMAPTGFSAFGGDVLIGNFGDGLIGAYDPSTGNLADLLRTTNGSPVAIDGLWGLAFGPGTGSTTLYFAAGPDGEMHGLVGTLTAP